MSMPSTCPKFYVLLALSLTLAACGDSGGGDTGELTSTTNIDGSTSTPTTTSPTTTSSTTTSSTTGASESSGSSSGESSDTGAAACVEDDLGILQEFKGPGYDPDKGGLQEPVQDKYWVSSTALVVRPEAEGEFLQLVFDMVPALMANPGYVALGLAGSNKCGTRRTMTVWRDQAAMFAFVMSAEHQAGVSKALDVSTTGTVTSWEVSKDAIPISWADASAKVDALPKSY